MADKIGEEQLERLRRDAEATLETLAAEVEKLNDAVLNEGGPSALGGRGSTSASEKVRENRLRRMAERQGYALTKTRRRDPRATDYGKYMIVNPMTNAVVAGAAATGRPEFTLDDVEEWLTGEKENGTP